MRRPGNRVYYLSLSGFPRQWGGYREASGDSSTRCCRLRLGADHRHGDSGRNRDGPVRRAGGRRAGHRRQHRHRVYFQHGHDSGRGLLRALPDSRPLSPHHRGGWLQALRARGHRATHQRNTAHRCAARGGRGDGSHQR